MRYISEDADVLFRVKVTTVYPPNEDRDEMVSVSYRGPYGTLGVANNQASRARKERWYGTERNTTAVVECATVEWEEKPSED